MIGSGIGGVLLCCVVLVVGGQCVVWYGEAVFGHACHVGLDDGFEALFHALGALGVVEEEVVVE